MKIKIKNKYISEKSPCFIIAEAGVNHNGSLKLAKKLVDAAKGAGADAVKFQTFRAEKIVTQEEPQYKMLKKLELPYSAFQKLKEHCDKVGIIFLSTPHSGKEDVDLVAKLCSAIKVASGDLTNLPFLKYIAQKNLPIILSTGMSNLVEIKEAVRTILPVNKKLILLHCTTNYPTSLSEVNLRAITTMAKEFDLPIGYSDHTAGINVSLGAVALGACVIEKHFTLDRNLPGPDHRASLEPSELSKLVKEIRSIEKALGDGIKRPRASELKIAKVVRKSLFAARDIKKGMKIGEDMIAIKRPGVGLTPKLINKIINRKTKRFITKDSLIRIEDLK